MPSSLHGVTFLPFSSKRKLEVYNYKINTFTTILANQISEVPDLTLGPLINKALAKIQVSRTLKISQWGKGMKVFLEIYFWLLCCFFPSQDAEVL